jgi:capsular exopolysaccharide synthesis family protein
MRESLPWQRQHLPAPHAAAAPATEYLWAPEVEEPGFRDYWKMLVKRRRLIALTFLAVVAVGAVLSLWTTTLYTATATLRIEPPGAPVIGTGEGAASGAAGDDYFQTQVALLKSRALAARVIKDLGLEGHAHFVLPATPIDWVRNRLMGGLRWLITQALSALGLAPEAKPVAPPAGGFELGVHPRAVNRYLGLLSVQPVHNTQLVTVAFQTVDPGFSQQLANAHAAAFIRMHLETRFELTKEAREFLEKKRDELKVKVGQSEEALDRFRKTYGVVSLEGNENIIVDRMLDLNRRLTEARAKRIELESLVRSLRDKNLAHLSQVIDNTLIVQLRARLEGLEAEQARLSTVFKPNHPRLQELENHVAQARQRLNQEIRTVVRAIEADYAAARSKEAALQAEADRQQQAALKLKELAVQHTLLQGELDANRTIYANVLKRLNETSISTDSPLSNIQIAEPAERPLGPSAPQTERNLLLAAALGLVLGVGLAVGLEHFNSALRTPEEVWRAVAIPTLGAIPHWRSVRRREFGFEALPEDSPLRFPPPPDRAETPALSPTLVACHHPFSLLAESYRTVRSGLLLTQTERPLRVVLVTSARPGEGKTSVALNLAISLAQGGRSVVVVDADLRAGNCHTLLGLPNRYGLAHLINDDLPLDVGLQRTAVPGLYLIPRGTLPPDPAELLGSDRMQQILQGLRERFDLVLLDTPPAVAVSDAVVLSVHCDGVVLVLRAQRTPTEAVQRVVERFETAGARILGTVLMGVDMRTPEFADFRHYYKSYYSSTHKGTKEPR